MSTTTFTMNTPEVALAALEAAAEKLNTATETMTAASKFALMLVAGPVLGLAFVIALPIVIVLLTAYYGGWLLATRCAGAVRFAKNVALFLIAPFVGLAYIIAFPFVGFGTLVYLGVKAARK